MTEKIWSKLYATASTGKIKQWQIWAIKLDTIENSAAIMTRHGYVDGKLTTKRKVIKIGKNIGKANETTAYEQACSEAESTYNKKIDKKYITEIPTETNKPNFILPMLAKDYKKVGHNIIYPCLAQPKLNGVRCMARKVAENEMDFTSRTGKSYNATLGHLVKELTSIMEIGEVFDGEIYYHGWSLQQISRRVKKLRNDTNLLEFWVYDVANDQNATQRNHRYTSHAGTGLKVICVLTKIVPNEKVIDKLHNDYVLNGFEGLILRNATAPYKFDHRSMDLQKYKKYMDDEFQIVDGLKDAEGGIVFICKIKNTGQTFKARPKGTLGHRINLYKNRALLVGKFLTVRFFEYSDDRIPLQPVGIVVRDYE